MKRVVAILIMVLGASFILPAVQAGAYAARDGDYYYALAQQEEQGNVYNRACRDYKKASSLYLKEGKDPEFLDAKDSQFRMEMILLDYTLTELKLKRQVKKVYPWATNGQIQNWIQTMGLLSMDFDDGRSYYYDEPNNLKFRNPEVMAGFIKDKNNPMKSFMEGFLKDYVNADYSQFHLPYDRPLDILIDFQLSIARSELPKTGTVRIWWPAPINTDSQSDVQFISLEPSKYIVRSSDLDADIGIVYFEIPVDALKEDLRVRSQVRYLHSQQRFSVDPANVGQYDKDSPLYKEYTRSYGDTLITPEIEAKAREIVGSETNPYLAAQLIYDYVVNHIDYSFTPHESLQVLSQAESVFVHTHRFGDCGAQSMYFSAMCRSLGIPARTCGGYQMLGGYPGTHFWAEFYLPNYGWVPVDVTAAEFAYQVAGFSDAELQGFKSYFFAQQDPLRMIIQKDVDLPLTPTPTEETYFKLAFQSPVFLLYGTDKQMTDISSAKFYSYSEQNFNFPDAYRLKGGSSFEINAADFGLVVFPEDTEVMLKDRYLDKTLSIKVKPSEFLDGNAGMRCVLPEGLDPIAFALSVNSKSTGEKKCSRPVIVLQN